MEPRWQDTIYYIRVRYWIARLLNGSIRIRNLRLFRIVAYPHQRIELTMFGKVGENLKASRRWLYTDADSAADKSTSKSIFRCVMCHVLPYDMFPVVRGIEKAARS